MYVWTRNQRRYANGRFSRGGASVKDDTYKISNAVLLLFPICGFKALSDYVEHAHCSSQLLLSSHWQSHRVFLSCYLTCKSLHHPSSQTHPHYVYSPESVELTGTCMEALENVPARVVPAPVIGIFNHRGNHRGMTKLFPGLFKASGRVARAGTGLR